MVTTPTVDGRSRRAPRRFQYGLGSLFLLTIGLAIVCSIFFALPDWVAPLFTVWLVIATPAILTVVLIYGRGRIRTFSIGALFPAGVCLVPLLPLFGIEYIERLLRQLSRSGSAENRAAVLFFFVCYCVFVVGDGLLAVWVHRLLERRGRPAACKSDPAEEGRAAADADTDAAISEPGRGGSW